MSTWPPCPRHWPRRGHQVTVYTRRDSADLPGGCVILPRLEVVHVDAGPARHVPKDDLLPFMGHAGRRHFAVTGKSGRRTWSTGISGCPAWRRSTRPAGGSSRVRVPVVQTFHALGTVKRRHQGTEDTSPVERQWLEPSVGRAVDRIIATCSDEVFELKAMGITPPGSRSPRAGWTWTSSPAPARRSSATARTGSCPSGGSCRARAWTS